MKRTRGFLAVLFSVAFCACLAAAPAGGGPVKKVRAGFYADNGSEGPGMLLLARILFHSPGIEVTVISGEDLRKGVLGKLDLLVCPGGRSGRQFDAMGPAGQEAVRNFLRRGGGYVGVCAGAFSTLPSPVRLGVLPFENIPNAWGRDSMATVEIPEAGAAVLGIAPGRRRVTYNGGPIVRPVTGPWPHGEGRALAFYKSTVSGPDRPAHKDFFNAPAIIYGNYGKGKAVGISFHPEKDAATEEIVTGAVYAVTGLKTAPRHPRKSFHPFRAGYFSAPAAKKSRAGAIRELLALDSSPRLTVRLYPFNDHNFDALDLLLLPEGPAGAYKGFGAKYAPMLETLLGRGGRIIACEEALPELPKHPGVIPVKKGSSLLKECEKIIKATK